MAERAEHTRGLLLSGGLIAEGFQRVHLIDRSTANSLIFNQPND